MPGASTRRKAAYWILVVAGLFAIGVFVLSPESDTSLPPGPATALAATLDRALDRPNSYAKPGVAVFAPTAQDDDPELSGLGHVLCDAIIERLLATGELRLVSCNSTRAAAQADVRGAYLAHLLGVDFSLSGTLSRNEHGVMRARIEMLDLRSEAAEWSLEDDIAQERLASFVERASTRVLRSVGVVTEAQEMPLDPVLYGKYLRATRLSREPASVARFEALQLIEAVLAEVPDHAPALYLQLALQSMLASTPAADQPAATSDALVTANALRIQRTQALGEQLLSANPHDWRGRTLMLNHAFEQRLMPQAFLHADGLSHGPGARPGGARINSQLHLYAGYLTRAQALGRQAGVADPLDANNYAVLAQAHAMAGDDPAARDFLDIVREISGIEVHRTAAILALRAGDHERFTDHLISMLSVYIADVDARSTVATAVIDPSRRDDAVAVLESIDPGTRVRMAGNYFEYALLGDVERSILAIGENATRAPAGWLQDLWWPELAEVRRHPDFMPAMSQLGLTQLWDREGAPDLCTRKADGAWGCR